MKFLNFNLLIKPLKLTICSGWKLNNDFTAKPAIYFHLKLITGKI